MGRKVKQKDLKKYWKKASRSLELNEVITNDHGLQLTKRQIEAYESAVEKVNAKAADMRKMFDALDYKIDGRPTGATVGQMRTMGKEYDFSIREKSVDINRFRTAKDFDVYMKNLDRVLSDNYVRDRARLYKRNYSKTLLDQFAYDDCSDIIMKIRTMPPEQYLQLVASNEELTIQWQYDEKERQGKLNKIRRALGIKEREDDDFWYDGEF